MTAITATANGWMAQIGTLIIGIKKVKIRHISNIIKNEDLIEFSLETSRTSNDCIFMGRTDKEQYEPDFWWGGVCEYNDTKKGQDGICKIN